MNLTLTTLIAIKMHSSNTLTADAMVMRELKRANYSTIKRNGRAEMKVGARAEGSFSRPPLLLLLIGGA